VAPARISNLKMRAGGWVGGVRHEMDSRTGLCTHLLPHCNLCSPRHEARGFSRRWQFTNPALPRGPGFSVVPRLTPFIGRVSPLAPRFAPPWVGPLLVFTSFPGFCKLKTGHLKTSLPFVQKLANVSIVLMEVVLTVRKVYARC